jgi:hypothetical protein
MQAAEALPSRAQPVWALSSKSAGVVALADGALTLGIVVVGRASWMLLAIALTVWIICGWSIYFRSAPRESGVARLGVVLLVTAGIAALAVLSEVYLLVLGPSWIL